MAQSDSSQAVLSELVKELVDAEDARRTALESRGAGVISTSGTIVTILFAVAAVSGDLHGFMATGALRYLLTLAIIALVVAGLLAMLTYAPQPTRIVDATKLKTELPEVWNDTGSLAATKAMATRLEQLAVSQKGNDLKAWILSVAFLVEIAGVTLLGTAVVTVLQN